MILIFGGSGSGKSAFAEKYITENFPDERRIYLATMKFDQDDEEAVRKIERHRRMRAGKGFETVEYTEIRQTVCHEFPGLTSDSFSKDSQTVFQTFRNSVVLMEDLPNLLSDEMFADTDKTTDADKQTDIDNQTDADTVSERIFSFLTAINDTARELVIVSGDVFSDAIIYDGLTTSYISILGRLHQMIERQAEEVFEICAGIPLAMKNPGKKYPENKDPGKKKESQHSEYKTMNTKTRSIFSDTRLILVLGGSCQGKTAFAASHFPDSMTVDHLETRIRKAVEDSLKVSDKDKMSADTQDTFTETFLKDLSYELRQKSECTDSDTVIISDLIGNGIVPVDAVDRMWREQTGRIQTRLVQMADEVYLVACGISTRIK